MSKFTVSENCYLKKCIMIQTYYLHFRVMVLSTGFLSPKQMALISVLVLLFEVMVDNAVILTCSSTCSEVYCHASQAW